MKRLRSSANSPVGHPTGGKVVLQTMDVHAVTVRDLLVLDRSGHTRLQVASFTLPHGEVCGVYGASEAAGTLFLNCVTGFHRPQRGTISIYGQRLPGAGSRRFPVGIVPPEGGLFRDFTARDNLDLALRFFGSKRYSRHDRAQKIQRIMAMLELEPWLETPVRDVYDAVRQRIRLGCALIHEPQLLVAHNPWGRVDAESRELIERTIRDHANRGNSLLFTAPRAGDVQALASEICLFNETGLVARGTLEHLQQYAEAQETILVTVQNQAARLLEPVSSLPGVIQSSATDSVVTIQAEPGSVRLTRLAERVQASGLELLGMGVRRPGLADVYAIVVGTGAE